MLKQRLQLFAIVSVLLFAQSLQASPLVYSPTNIKFGGLSPDASSVLFSQAQAQSTHKDPNAIDPFAEKTQLERFQEALERRILDILAGQVIEDAFGSFGEGGLGNGGTFSTDEFSVTINTNNPDVIVVGITDLLGGGETTIEIPNLVQ